jgi:pyrroloquinoline quinone (PQQ) biosynthesis protein C
MNELSNSQLLRRKIELLLPAFAGAGRRLWTHPRVRDIYPDYLFMVHSMIRASVPLMETARDRAAAMEDDAVAAGVADYLRQHIREEMHHDDWLLDDAERLGRDRARLLERAPSPKVAQLVGAQYYWILHYHPVALLGYIAILEGYPPSVEMVDDLVDRTGYPAEVFHTLRKHAHLDPYHRDGLNAALDGLPLEPRHTSIVGVSAIQTISLFVDAIDELLAPYEVAEESVAVA